MNRLLRIVKHGWRDAADARRAVGDAALDRLEQRVRASEQHHSGEIRVCVEAALPWSDLLRGATARERALSLFGQLRVWDTEHNNGVLVYLLLAEHAIEIVADRGLDRRVPGDEWQRIAAKMAQAFRAGRFEDGLAQAIDAVDAHLSRHFAVAESERNPNELPDTVHVI
jgi:uncharacterized membrane protein